ncbi:MAG: biotin/lipoyl-containing protein, partial [Nitriliruptoraceae bacterium]
MAEVQLPQLGESVTEGIITQWLVAVGDTVDVDQPLAEISTDKVDTEIPSPIAGTVKELRFSVDDTVEVGQVIAVIGDSEASDTDDTDDKADDKASEPDDSDEPDDEPAASTPLATTTQTPTAPSSQVSDAGRSVVTSPLVRKLLREAGLDPADVSATGQGGRVTREDAERAIAQRDAAPASAAPPSATAGPTINRERPPASPNQVEFGGEREVTQDLSRIRKVIASSMMDSLQSTAQLTAAVEAD